MSPTLKSTWVGHFGAKFGEDGVDRCKPNFNAIWEDTWGLSYAKKINVDIFFRLSMIIKTYSKTILKTGTKNCRDI